MAKLVRLGLTGIISVFLASASFLGSASGPSTPVDQHQEPRVAYDAQAPIESDRVRDDPIRGRFALANKEIGQQGVSLVFSVDPLIDFPGTTVRILLPDELQLSDGSTSWSGDISAEVAQSSSFSVRPSREGTFLVRAVVENPRWSRDGRVYQIALTVSGTAASIDAPTPPIDSPGVASSGSVARLEAVGSASGLSDRPTGSAVTTISGRQQYQRLDGNFYPSRHSRVGLYDYWTDALIASSTTDSSGYYTLSLSLAASRDVYIKVWCDNSAAAGKDSSDETYFTKIPAGYQTVSPGYAYDVGPWYSEFSVEAWEAVDHALTAWQFLYASTDWYRSQVTIHWPQENWPHSHGDSIDLPAKSVAYWDRSSIFHEYGHAVMFANYGAMFHQCSFPTHYLFTESCPTFAFAEGFAEFFTAAVDNNPAAVSWYSSSDPVCRHGDIEANQWELGYDCVANNSGSVVEGAVASILWDLFDSPGYTSGDIDRDYLNLGFAPVWYTILDYHPTTIDEFWTQWITHHGYQSQTYLIYRDHGVSMGQRPVYLPLVIRPAH